MPTSNLSGHYKQVVHRNKCRQDTHSYTYKYIFKKRECSLELDIFESHIYLIAYKTKKKDNPKLKTSLVKFKGR